MELTYNTIKEYHLDGHKISVLELMSIRDIFQFKPFNINIKLDGIYKLFQDG